MDVASGDSFGSGDDCVRADVDVAPVAELCARPIVGSTLLDVELCARPIVGSTLLDVELCRTVGLSQNVGSLDLDVGAP